MSKQALPLEGIRVVDYTHFLAGPYLSRCLAAMGAEVIKVERPTSGDPGRASPVVKDGQSGYFLQQNMGKQGLCVNLKDPRGLEMLHKLVADADVFIENYRPGALDRLGLGYKELSALNPKLVYCSISAYGHTGPDAHRPGFGLIAEAKSGMLAQIGVEGKAPPLLRTPLGDMYTGIHGVAAVNAALFGRVRSGLGQHIDLALYDCLVSMHDYAVQSYTFSDGAQLPQRTGSVQPDSTVYGVFPARDGYLVVAAQVDDAWRRLAKLIGGDDLMADQRLHSLAGRNANGVEVCARVEAWTMAQDSVAACCLALDAVDVPCAPVQNIEQVINDPQIKARGMMIEQHHPLLGKVLLPNLPFNFSGCDTTQTVPAPLMGQHNRQIAASLGYSAAQIAEMERDKVLYAEAAVARLAA
jgi:crotonobetainyl-CoA:carnitine CoA-transferase CaiB-like acyl-CoA transferase